MKASNKRKQRANTVSKLITREYTHNYMYMYNVVETQEKTN